MATTFITPTGVQTPTVPDTFFFTDNWVSPMLPTYVVSQPQGRGMEQRVEGDGKSECRLVIGRIGLHTWTYPTRKGADFRLVLTVENAWKVRTFGEVRRWIRPLNGPKAQRNQQWTRREDMDRCISTEPR
jgi:hypothetical protein